MIRVKTFSRVLQKKIAHVKALSFITQFKIDFLLPFTGLRKVLVRMPVII